MKKRLIKKAYRKAISGINTRIRPKGYHGKAIAVFNEFKLLWQFKNIIKQSKDPLEIIMYSGAMGATLVRAQMIQSQPILPERFKSGGIVSAEGKEEILLRSGKQLILN